VTAVLAFAQHEETETTLRADPIGDALEVEMLYAAADAGIIAEYPQFSPTKFGTSDSRERILAIAGALQSQILYSPIRRSGYGSRFDAWSRRRPNSNIRLNVPSWGKADI
jgi:hypothetical protein